MKQRQTNDLSIDRVNNNGW